MRKKVIVPAFCRASASAETLKVFQAPGIREALLNNCAFRIVFAEHGTGKSDALSWLNTASTTGGTGE